MLEPQIENGYVQGQQEGQKEAGTLLAEATRAKGEPLTASEIRDLSRRLFAFRWAEWSLGSAHGDWFGGWCAAFALGCLKAEQAAPISPENKTPSADVQKALLEYVPPEILTDPRPCPVFQFRHATVTGDMIEFFEGMQEGQTAQREDTAPLSTANLFWAMVGEPMDAFEGERCSEDWLLGYLLGRVDMLLHDRCHSPLYQQGYEEYGYV